MLQVPNNSKIQAIAPAKIKVESILENFVPSMLKSQFKTLEASITAEGCKTPLIVWERENEYILVDGHNRLNICKKNSIDFLCELRTFESYEAVKNFMLSIQFGRRNMNGVQEILMRGQDYANSKKSKTDTRSGSGVDTAELLAQKYTRLTGVSISAPTIRRNEKTFLLMESIKAKSPQTYENIIQFNIDSPTHIEALSYLPPLHQQSFERLADLQEQRPSLYDSEHINALITDFVRLGKEAKEAKEAKEMLIELLDKLSNEEFKEKVLTDELGITNNSLQEILAYPRPNQEAFIKTYIETKNFFDAWEALKKQVQIFKPEPAPVEKNLSVHGEHSNYVEEEFTPAELEIIEKIRAIHPQFADALENGETEWTNLHEKILSYSAEVAWEYCQEFLESENINKAWNALHAKRKELHHTEEKVVPNVISIEDEKLLEGDEEISPLPGEEKTIPTEPLIISTQTVEKNIFVVYNVINMTPKNRLQNAVADFARQYKNIAFNDFASILAGVKGEVERLNNLYKNCTSLKIEYREEENYYASIWITPIESTTPFETSIFITKIKSVLEGASFGEAIGLRQANQENVQKIQTLENEIIELKAGTPTEQDLNEWGVAKEKTQINMLQLHKLKKIELADDKKICILKVVGKNLMEFQTWNTSMEWVNLLEYESNAQALKEAKKIVEKSNNTIILNF